ncbi:MAG: DUF2156 domain-containing protein [Planctomycetales bacterium]|nr:DUF2156 domain-containing protein [Planctomycetales bacterium]
MPAPLAAVVEQCAYDYGNSYDAYLVVESGREYFLASGEPGCVGFTRHGSYAHVVGGLLTAPAHRHELLREFLAFAHRERLHVSFYNVAERDVAFYRRQGFQLTKWGEDPVIDLRTTTWQGKAFEWLRRQENFCRRQGVEICEIVPDADDPDFRDHTSHELNDVSQSHLRATKHGRELGMLVSRFNPLDLKRRRLWVARREGRVEAFIVGNPCAGGREWAIETYRRRAEATRGVMPALMMAAMRQMQREGIEGVSLCLIPCLRCETPTEGDSALVRRGLSFWWRHGNWLFDMRGIYHYKSRFRPEFRPMYVAASPRITFGSMRSCLRKWEVCRPNPAALMRSMGQWLQKLAPRRSLAAPTTPTPTRPRPEPQTVSQRGLRIDPASTVRTSAAPAPQREMIAPREASPVRAAIESSWSVEA